MQIQLQIKEDNPIEGIKDLMKPIPTFCPSDPDPKCEITESGSLLSAWLPETDPCRSQSRIWNRFIIDNVYS